nr:MULTISPECIES: hypothetical protein [Nocardiopsis]
MLLEFPDEFSDVVAAGPEGHQRAGAGLVHTETVRDAAPDTGGEEGVPEAQGCGGGVEGVEDVGVAAALEVALFGPQIEVDIGGVIGGIGGRGWGRGRHPGVLQRS